MPIFLIRYRVLTFSVFQVARNARVGRKLESEGYIKCPCWPYFIKNFRIPFLEKVGKREQNEKGMETGSKRIVLHA